MNITYRQNGDYLIPNIIIRKTKPIGWQFYLELSLSVFIVFFHIFLICLFLLSSSPTSFPNTLYDIR